MNWLVLYFILFYYFILFIHSEKSAQVLGELFLKTKADDYYRTLLNNVISYNE